MLITNLIEKKISIIINQIDSLNEKNIDIDLELNRHSQKIIYQSPCCLILASKNQINSLLLAQQISNTFNQIDHNQELISQVSAQGWLEFIVSDRLIEKYLNHLHKQPITIKKTEIIIQVNSPIKFTDYYLHARCCSLLTSANNQKIITFNNLDFMINKWQIIKPEIISYRLCYQHSHSEVEIIKQIILISEKINHNKLLVFSTLKTLKKLFWTLESKTSIWGETLTNNRQLSQARLGLIALILHYYQNIFYSQYQQTLPIQI